MSKGARGDVARQVAVVLGRSSRSRSRSSPGRQWEGCPERTRRSWYRLTTHSSSGPPSSFGSDLRGVSGVAVQPGEPATEEDRVVLCPGLLLQRSLGNVVPRA